MSLITVNTNNTSETERSKKSRKVSHYATTPYFVKRQHHHQQQQQNRFFFNNRPKNDICYKKFYLEIHPVVSLHNQVKGYIFLALVWSVMLKQKTQQ